MKNETKLKEMCKKENRIMLVKEWLRILFFVAAILVAIIYVKTLSTPCSNPVLVIEQDKAAAITIIVTFLTFLGLAWAGYFYNLALSSKLDQLRKKKIESIK